MSHSSRNTQKRPFPGRENYESGIDALKSIERTRASPPSGLEALTVFRAKSDPSKICRLLGEPQLHEYIVGLMYTMPTKPRLACLEMLGSSSMLCVEHV